MKPWTRDEWIGFNALVIFFVTLFLILLLSNIDDLGIPMLAACLFLALVFSVFCYILVLAAIGATGFQKVRK